jgi:hypothetical protein
MKTLNKENVLVDYEREIKESFELFKLKEREIPSFTDSERFARDNFKRCDKMEYAHTRYSVTTSAIE